MDISFVVPAFNEEALIKQCIASIRATALATDLLWEIVVVDNASTDATAAIVGDMRYWDSRIRVVSEPRKGLAWARTAGCNAAWGELLANIDADVLLPVRWLRKVWAEFKADDSLVALSGPNRYLELNPFEQRMVSGFYRLGSITSRFLGPFVQGGNFVVRDWALHAVGGFDTKHFQFYGEDTAIAQSLAKVGRVKFSPEHYVYASARRYREEGLVRLGSRYGANYVWAALFGRPFTRTWQDHRG